jgi:5'-methylthioadenosine phosphorylase
MGKPLLGVIGGSGLCQLPKLSVSESVDIETLYGKPSAPVVIGEMCGGRIAFLPRHGSEHTIPPHKVPYKANLWALKSIGVQHVIATCVVGSLRKEIEPGMFVVPDQFINFTWGRDDTYGSDHQLVHLQMAEPYCEHVRSIIIREIEAMGARIRSSGTVVVIQGPRFSTIAESKMFALWGGDIVNMTQYPECYFARELGLCYGVMATVTDYDVGVPSPISMRTDSMDAVLAVFRRNTEATISLVERLVVSEDITDCACAKNRITEYYKLANKDSS